MMSIGSANDIVHVTILGSNPRVLDSSYTLKHVSVFFKVEILRPVHSLDEFRGLKMWCWCAR
jgi:hypothetical protein